MKLVDTEVFIDFTKNQPHTLGNLSVVFVSLYLEHYRVSNSSENSDNLLQTPGCKTDNVLVSGVANTTRHLLLLKDHKHTLLGLNAGCLSGTKEISPWTKIVEVTFPDDLSSASNILEVQDALRFLEKILETPFNGHNRRKIRQEAIELGILPEHGLLSHKKWQALPLFRRFIHGLHCGATDLLIFAMLTAKLSFLGSSVADLNGSDFLIAYIQRLNKISSGIIGKYMDIVREINIEQLSKLSNNYIEETNDILASTDLEGVAVDPSNVLAEKTINKINMIVSEYPYTEHSDVPVDWDLLNDCLKPQRNLKNNVSKMQQLQSMLAGVSLCISHLKSLYSSKIRIVDFCSGGGHLGIFLAHQFPECQVILVETKWGSLRYAKDRIDKLGLVNTTLCLAHMGQFCGKFELGVSLHACGSATDIVIEHCLRKNAAIVSSPCCYGKIVNSSNITYPKSKQFADEIFQSGKYFTVSKLADHESENEMFMKCIDIDRIKHIKDNDYQFASISKLKPLTCSPKNNLIVAFK